MRRWIKKIWKLVHRTCAVCLLQRKIVSAWKAAVLFFCPSFAVRKCVLIFKYVSLSSPSQGWGGDSEGKRKRRGRLRIQILYSCQSSQGSRWLSFWSHERGGADYWVHSVLPLSSVCWYTVIFLVEIIIRWATKVVWHYILTFPCNILTPE